MPSFGELCVVEKVDVARYMGKWYEIAHLPTRFQKGCSDTTATYTLLPNGKVRVFNECVSQGRHRSIVGSARVADPKTNAKLKVTFFWPFSAPYWIIALGADYEYAVVGEPGRNYLWILSRAPEIAPGLYERLVRECSEKGFDVSTLIRTGHSGAPGAKVK